VKKNSKRNVRRMANLLKAIPKTTTHHLELGIFYCACDGENKAYQDSVYTV